MNTLKIARTTLLGLVALFAASLAQAAPIAYNMSGVFDLYNQINGITYGQSTFSASYTYDPATGFSSQPDPNTGTYFPYTLTLSVPDLDLLLVSVPATFSTLEVSDNNSVVEPMVTDQFRSQGGNVTESLPSSITQLQTQFTLFDGLGTALSGTGLPQSLSLASFSNKWFQLNIVPSVWPGPGSICSEIGSGGSVVCTANGTITSFYVSTAEAVPEPATMLLVGLGLMGLAGVRRKFKN